MKKYLLVFGLFISISLSAQLRINELMQSNIDCLMDELFDFPDSWVEIYNESEEPVNINGWYIGEKKDYLKGWRIQKDTIVPAKGYLVIFCDKVGEGIHTDFRLETTKESNLYLFDPNGNKVDEVKDIPAQPNPNIAYGCISEGSFHFLIDATPGYTNNHLTASQITSAPKFEQRAGVYKTPIKIAITDTSNIPNAKIYYTIDNSEPNRNSLVYTGPIAIDTTTVIRAKVIADNYLIPRSLAQTYIITDRELTLPIISISTDNRYLWDDSIGIYCVGKNGKETSYPGVEKANFWWDWRRPMIFSYFANQNSKETLNQLGELRIAGGGSRIYPTKSLILYSHKRFGKKEFDCQFFHTEDKKDVIIKSLMLRNSGQDWGDSGWYEWFGIYFNDAANQLLLGGKVDLDYQAYQPAILYINGQYWGIINIRERSEEDYVYGNYNRLENVDVIENMELVQAGDNVALSLLLKELENGQLNYNAVSNNVDILEFVNFFILRIFLADLDFPARNVIIWRERIEGAKWRFIVKDTDIGGIITSADHNTIDYILNEENYDLKEIDFWLQRSFFFRELMSFKEVRELFVRYFTVYLGDILTSKKAFHMVDSLKGVVEQEMPFHLMRFDISTMELWEKRVEKKKEWLSERISYQYQHLNDYMGYSGLVDLTIEKPLGEGEFTGFMMQLNGVDLQTNQFDGMYYKGQSFILDWKGDPTKLRKWRVSTVYADRESPVITTYTSPSIEIAVQNKVKSIHIQPEMEDSNSSEMVASSSFTVLKELNGIRLINIKEKSRISIFDFSGKNIYTGEISDNHILIPLTTRGTYLVQLQNRKETITRKVLF